MRGWDRRAPLVVHCFAGISRSTASAYTAVCALSPQRGEHSIAQALRRASPTATPNIRIVSLADSLFGRDGRMIAAIETIGRGVLAAEATPFRLDLEVKNGYSASDGRSTGRELAIGVAAGCGSGALAEELGARIALVEIAIGKAEAGDRAAEAAVAELLHPKARGDRQAGQMGAHRAAIHLYRSGRQGREPGLALAAKFDGADDRAVGENPAAAGGTFKAGIGEQLSHHESAGLIRTKVLGQRQAGGEQFRPPKRNAPTTATRRNIDNSTPAPKDDVNKTS